MVVKLNQKMTYKINLDGVWQAKCFDNEVDAICEKNSVEIIPAKVPGDVHLDLLETGKISDPYFSKNIEDCQWISEKFWVYKKTFQLDKNQFSEKCNLVFKGLDTYSTIFLNDKKIGKTKNMFVEHRFDVTDFLQTRENEIVVRFTPPLEPIADKNINKYPAAFDSLRLFNRKMQSSSGWDWAPKIHNIGIWRSVEFEFYNKARIKDIFVQTVSIDEEKAIIKIDIENEIFSSASNSEIKLAVEIPNIYKNIVSAKKSQTFSLEIPNPKLWWTNGDGEQYLYSLTISLINNEKKIDSKKLNFGIRTIEIEEEAAKRGSTFIVKINGEKRFIKGANWVPFDSFPAAPTQERYREILRLTRDANINMLRVWGGGIYESPDFYDACDEFGILIWQDFMFACGNYPEDDKEWLDNVKYELPIAFNNLKNYTCIAVWCGNNECGMNVLSDENYSGKKLFENYLKNLCETDSTRPYRITSPYGGKDVNSPDVGDMHFGAWIECARTYEPEKFSEYVIEKCNGRFHSEIHTMGVPPMRSLNRFMSDKEIGENCGEIWEYHTKNNPYDGCKLTYIQRMQAFVKAYYGEPTKHRLLTDMLAYQQHEIITQHIEHHRRSMFDCSGVLFWSLNECWPCICGSMIDYYLAQKAGYFAAKRGFKPTIISIDFNEKKSATVWISNDLLESFEAKVEFAAISFNGEKIIEKFSKITVETNSATKAINVPTENLSNLDSSKYFLIAKLKRNGEEIDRTIKPLSLPKDWNLPSATLEAKLKKINEKTFQLKISTDFFARVITIEPLGTLPTAPTNPSKLMKQCDVMIANDNYFDLLAGESRTILIECRNPLQITGFEIRTWNSVPLKILSHNC